MTEYACRLLIVSRDLLTALAGSSSGDFVYRQLANLNRRGVLMLLTASAPDHWVPTRGSVDDAMEEQGRIEDRMRRMGGEFDGVYYVARSLLTQDRNRRGALQDILRRYALEAHESCLLSGSKPFVKAAARLGLNTLDTTASPKGISQLIEEIKPIQSEA